VLQPAGVKIAELCQGEYQVATVILAGFLVQEFKDNSRMGGKLLVQVKAVEDQARLTAGLAFDRAGIGLAVGDAQAGLGGADRGGTAGN
jgi:hypothetical protein